MLATWSTQASQSAESVRFVSFEKDLRGRAAPTFKTTTQPRSFFDFLKKTREIATVTFEFVLTLDNLTRFLLGDIFAGNLGLIIKDYQAYQSCTVAHNQIQILLDLITKVGFLTGIL